MRLEKKKGPMSSSEGGEKVSLSDSIERERNRDIECEEREERQERETRERERERAVTTNLKISKIRRNQQNTTFYRI